MRTPYSLIFTIAIFMAMPAVAQKEFADWYFGGNNKLSFQNNNIAEFKTDFITTGTYWWNYRDIGSSGLGYNDPLTGEMKFVISGVLTYDKNGDVMLDAELLRNCPGDKYAFHIIPFQNNPNRFYIIQNQDPSGAILAAQTGLQVRCPNPIGLAYSILDLSLNNGKGGYVVANKVLWGGVSARVAIVRHANGRDAWIVSHPASGGYYNSYLVTDAGIQSPITSTVGPVLQYSFEDVQTGILASHNGKMLLGFSKDQMEQYDFNNATGVVSNYRKINLGRYVGGKSFSPDDSKFYFTGGYPDKGLFQLDFDAPDLVGSLTKIADDRYESMYDMQLGLDGKIYISHYYEFDSNDQFNDYLATINCPNLAKYACNFVQKGIYAPRGVGQLPAFINDYGKQPKQTPATEIFIGNDAEVCFGTYTINAPTGWDHYEWNTGETTRQITVDKPGLYYVLAKNDGFSCPAAYGYITLTSKAKPLNLGKDTISCPRSTYTLQVPANFNHIKWDDGTTDRTKYVTTSKNFFLTATDENGCTNRDTIYVGFWGDPQASFGNDTTLCNDQTLLLEMFPKRNIFTTTDFHKWSDGSTKDSLRVRESGTYWGEVTYNGCTLRDTIKVNYINTAGVYLGADTTICDGSSLQLKANVQPATYLWSTGATDQSIDVTIPGTYWVRVNNGACTLTDTIKVNVQSKHQVDLGPDTTLCEGNSFLLKLNNANAQYNWQDNSVKNEYKVTQPGWYWIDLNLNGCVIRDSIHVDYKPSPVLSLGKDTSLCTGGNLVLNAFDPSLQSYQWNNGSISSSITVANSGNYSVRATAPNGCSISDTIKVNFSGVPVFDLGNDTVVCENEQVELKIKTTAGYEWSNGRTTSSIVVSEPGTYWAKADLNGCIFHDTITIGTRPNPVVHLGADTAICEGSQKVLNGFNPNATYVWNDGSRDATYIVTKPGRYSVEVNMAGCTAGDTIRIDYISKPDISLGEDRAICAGQEYMLQPSNSNAYAFKWNNNSTSPQQTISQPGSYFVEASNTCGISSDTIVITKGTCLLILPNAFTPNNDGVNDEFGIKDPGFIATFQMTIFNRWGQIVFKTNDPYKKWDGKKNGEVQPVDTYVWYITLVTNDGKTESARGAVQLIR
jgi:gliding motility-associated-like protein